MIETRITRSRAIDLVQYDPETKRLWISFTSGNQKYEYRNVPEHIHAGLIKATSVGGYYDDHIRDRYEAF